MSNTHSILYDYLMCNQNAQWFGLAWVQILVEIFTYNITWLIYTLIVLLFYIVNQLKSKENTRICLKLLEHGTLYWEHEFWK